MFKVATFLFLQLFVPNDNAFGLLSILVAQMLLTRRWVGRRTDAKATGFEPTITSFVNEQSFSQTGPVWLNGWVFVYELSACGFESHCCHLNFRYGACFEQGVP